MYLPISINLINKKVLIIGGGKVALHKLKTILLFTDNITVLAPDMLDEMKDKNVDFIEAEYKKELLDGYFLVYACTNNREINKCIKYNANAKGILVNVADNLDLCDFISPAVYKNGCISVSVSSAGKNVKEAIKIRDKIAETLKGKN